MRAVFVSIILALCVGSSMQACAGRKYPPGVAVCTTSNGVVLHPNYEYTSYKTCEKCSCKGNPDSGLTEECCGIGINAGVRQPPAGCKYIKGANCEAVLVQAKDESKPCH